MDDLIKRAKELIETSAVKVVIGYEQGTGNKTRALFVEKKEDADKLIFDSRCVQNLATYITKKEVKAKGKMADCSNFACNEKYNSTCSRIPGK